MKIFYDNLLSYMPHDVAPSRELYALREVMSMLAFFQNTQDVGFLYKAVYHLSVFAGMSIDNLMLSLSDVQVPSGTIDSLLDQVAVAIFGIARKAIIEEKFLDFDYKYYVAILLTIAHTLYQIQNGFVRIDEPKPVANVPEAKEPT